MSVLVKTVTRREVIGIHCIRKCKGIKEVKDVKCEAQENVEVTGVLCTSK